ncbi:hypothetical protein [Bradyrhizobium sp. RT9a]|uniref:hypothetical protein n=1 Tax=Bradyrhizobium sp. RT9a TaxID=3156384 RepID=UPI0033919CC5
MADGSDRLIEDESEQVLLYALRKLDAAFEIIEGMLVERVGLTHQSAREHAAAAAMTKALLLAKGAGFSKERVVGVMGSGWDEDDAFVRGMN